MGDCDMLSIESSLFKSSTKTLIFSGDFNNELLVVEELCSTEESYYEVVDSLKNREFIFKRNLRFPLESKRDIDNLCTTSSLPSLPFIGIPSLLVDLRSYIYMDTITGGLLDSAKDLLTKESYDELIEHIDISFLGRYENFTSQIPFCNKFSTEDKFMKYESILTKIKQSLLSSISFKNYALTPITDRYLYLECEGVYLNIYAGESFWKFLVENRKEELRGK